MKPNFQLIGANHNLWCMKLTSFVNGGASQPPVKSYRECELGKWVYKNGLSEYGQIPELKQLEGIHQNLHSTAEKIVGLKNSGDVRGAQQELLTMQDYSDQVIKLLKSLDLKIS